MSIPPPSEEQLNIINSLQNYNLIVDAVAGSGKTTTTLHIAKKYADSNVLLLTYNAKLKQETRGRVKSINYKNIDVHSYHSFGVKYYSNSCTDDSGIRCVLNSKNKSKKNICFDIIIIDEAQDITPILFQFIHKIINDNNTSAKLCIMGDERQSIYDYNGADSRFLRYANVLFKRANSIPWAKFKLSFSYRLSDTMADFVNNCVFGYKFIKTVKPSKYKPIYMKCNIFSDEPFNKVIEFLNMGYSYEDILILAPSVRIKHNEWKSPPIRYLENRLAEKKIPIYIPTSDQCKIKEKYTKGKIMMSTYHQAKGIERKIVFVFNFCMSYFDFYDKNGDRGKCPKPIYVAITRAKEHLILFHSNDFDYLPFINKELLEEYCEVIDLPNNKKEKKEGDKNNGFSCTELSRYIKNEILDECTQFLEITEVKPKSKKIMVPNEITRNGCVYDVSATNGTAIPAMYEMEMYGKCKIVEECAGCMKVLKYGKCCGIFANFCCRYSAIINYMKTTNKINMLEVATFHSCFVSGNISMINVKPFNWISNDNKEKLMNRLKSLKISKKSEMEHRLDVLPSSETPELNGYGLHGVLDCIDYDNKIVYEFKCVQNISKEYYIQLAMYMYLNELNGNKGFRYFIYNILDDNLIEIKCNLDILKHIVNYIVESKIFTRYIADNDEFIEGMAKLI